MTVFDQEVDPIPGLYSFESYLVVLRRVPCSQMSPAMRANLRSRPTVAQRLSPEQSGLPLLSQFEADPRTIKRLRARLTPRPPLRRHPRSSGETVETYRPMPGTAPADRDVCATGIASAFPSDVARPVKHGLARLPGHPTQRRVRQRTLHGHVR